MCSSHAFSSSDRLGHFKTNQEVSELDILPVRIFTFSPIMKIHHDQLIVTGFFLFVFFFNLNLNPRSDLLPSHLCFGCLKLESGSVILITARVKDKGHKHSSGSCVCVCVFDHPTNKNQNTAEDSFWLIEFFPLFSSPWKRKKTPYF